MFSNSIIRLCSVLIILLWCYDAVSVSINASPDTRPFSDELAPLLFRGIITIPAILALVVKGIQPSTVKNGLFLVLLFIESLMVTSRWWADDALQPGFLFIMVGIPMAAVLSVLLLSNRIKS